MFSTLRPALLALAVMAPAAPPALAHHGWNWTEDKQTEMTGEITEIFIGPPLRVQPLPNSNFHY